MFFHNQAVFGSSREIDASAFNPLPDGICRAHLVVDKHIGVGFA